MDLGCYVVNFIRLVMGNEPELVSSAKATLLRPNVDSRMEATLQFSENRTATLNVDLRSWTLSNYATITGTKGKIVITGLPAFGLWHSIKVTTSTGTRTEKHYGSGESTYFYQLDDFVKLVRGREPSCKTMGEDGIRNMKVIDSIYKKAGLPPRGYPFNSPSLKYFKALQQASVNKR